MTTRQRRDETGASLVEYALLMAMILLVVFASVYALGRSPDRPASVLSESFRNPPARAPGLTVSPTSSSTSTSVTTTTTRLPPP